MSTRLTERLLGRPISPRVDRIGRGVIVAACLLVLLAVAWESLDLGTLLFPPAPTAPSQTVGAGPYQVTLQLDAGQFATSKDNAALLLLTDANGQPAQAASVTVQAVMPTMEMTAPTAAATLESVGRYRAHLDFAMPGSWQLNLTIAAPGQPDAHATFTVTVQA